MLTVAMIGGPDLVIVALVVLVLFGGAKVGGFMKSLGEGVKEFKKATIEDETQVASGSAPSPAPVSPAQSAAAAQPTVSAPSTGSNEEK